MGNWTIKIEGTGCHHNQSNPEDANRQAVRFVNLLRNEGSHTIRTASFTVEGREPENIEMDPYPPLLVNPVAETKRLRARIRDLVSELQKAGRNSRSRSLATTKLEEASMWLGKDLQELNEPNPYPNSHNPGDPKIDPTAPEACKLAGA